MPETDDAGTAETSTDTAGQDTGTTAEQSTDWEAEAKKWRDLSRKNEDRAKANAGAAKELEQLRASQMSDTDKAVAEAKNAAKAEARSEFGQRLAAAEIRAALAGVVKDPASIVEDLNLAKYVTDDGEVDTDAVAALKTKLSELTPGTGSADLKQGVRGGNADAAPDGNEWMRQMGRV